MSKLIFFYEPGVNINDYLKKNDDVTVLKIDFLETNKYKNLLVTGYLSFLYVNSQLLKKYKIEIGKIRKEYINDIEFKKKNNIFNKNYLHIITKKNDPDFFKKYLMNQIEIKNQKQIDNFVKKNKYYIVKPIPGHKGLGQKIFNSSNAIMNHIKKFSYSKNDEKLYKLYNNKKNQLWVLQEYITNPLLIKDKKFHIRLLFLNLLKNNKKYYYIYNKYFIIPAKKKYDLKSKNKNIHNSHGTGMKLDDYKYYLKLFNKIPEKYRQHIYNQIIDICKYYCKYMDYKCYYESENCFSFCGYDLMITDKYEVKCIEINQRPGGFADNWPSFWSGLLDLTLRDKKTAPDYLRL